MMANLSQQIGTGSPQTKTNNEFRAGSWINVRLALAGILAFWAPFLRGPAESAPRLIIRNVTLIDATNGVRPAMDVEISDGLIKRVARAATHHAGRESGTIEGKGKYLIPGLWDMHVHSFWTKELPAQHLPLFIANGVVGARDLGSPLPLEELLPWARGITNGSPRGPCLLFAGKLLDGDPPVWKGSLAVSDAAEARQAVRQLKHAGVDCVKVYSRLGREAYLAAAEEARRLGLPILGHLPIGVTPAEAVKAGHRSIEHSSELLLACSPDESSLRKALVESKPGPEREAIRRRQVAVLASTFDRAKAVHLARMFRENEVFLVPTLVANRVFAVPEAVEYDADSRSRYVPPATLENWRKRIAGFLDTRSLEERKAQTDTYKKELELLRIMLDQGVPIMTGTDADLFAPAGFGLHDELSLLVKDAGLKPLEAVAAATRTPARYLRRRDISGTIEAGKLADLVLLDANPLDDISNTRRIAGVVLKGAYFDRQAIAKMLQDVERAVGSRSSSPK